MRFSNSEIIINHDDLNRRKLVFTIIDRYVLLDLDIDESRKSKRHKWVVEKRWSRLGFRGNSMERRDVPVDVIDKAVDNIKQQITYVTEYRR